MTTLTRDNRMEWDESCPVPLASQVLPFPSPRITPANRSNGIDLADSIDLLDLGSIEPVTFPIPFRHNQSLVPRRPPSPTYPQPYYRHTRPTHITEHQRHGSFPNLSVPLKHNRRASDPGYTLPSISLPIAMPQPQGGPLRDKLSFPQPSVTYSQLQAHTPHAQDTPHPTDLKGTARPVSQSFGNLFSASVEQVIVQDSDPSFMTPNIDGRRMIPQSVQTVDSLPTFLPYPPKEDFPLSPETPGPSPFLLNVKDKSLIGHSIHDFKPFDSEEKDHHRPEHTRATTDPASTYNPTPLYIPTPSFNITQPTPLTPCQNKETEERWIEENRKRMSEELMLKRRNLRQSQQDQLDPPRLKQRRWSWQAFSTNTRGDEKVLDGWEIELRGLEAEQRLKSWEEGKRRSEEFRDYQIKRKSQLVRMTLNNQP